MNTMRISLLIAAMTALFMGIRYLMGAEQGMLIRPCHRPQPRERRRSRHLWLAALADARRNRRRDGP